MAQQNKEHQKKLLTEIMEADQKNGLYDHIGDTNKMVTAVEWLVEEIEKHYIINNGGLNPTIVMELKRQAKQMEKEQMIDAHIEGQRVFDRYPHTQWTNDQAKEYYNETYGTK